MNAGWFYGLLLVGKMADQSVGRSCRHSSFRATFLYAYHKWGPTVCAFLINPSLFS